MFRKFLPILAISLWAMSGTSDEVNACPSPCNAPESNSGMQPLAQKPAPKTDMPSDQMPAPAPEGDCCPKPCKPCPKPCPPKCKPACPAPCPKPCPPKPCCNPPPPCCWQFNPCNPKGCTDMNCEGFFVSADFLYWRSENHGFSYAFELDAPLAAGFEGDVVRIDPKFDPAFRVGLGWNTTYDFWDVFLNYTWYRNHASDTTTSSNGFIRMLPLSSSATAEFSTVSANSRLMMNMGDLEIGRMIYLTKSIAIRPHWGAKGGTMNQKFKDHFSGFLSGANDEFKFNGKNNYWGVGPRAGVNGELHVSSGFSVLGKVAGALLYGKTKTTSYAKNLLVGGTSFDTFSRYTDDFYALVPNLQVALGLQWQTCFWCEKMLFKMSASWENNYWWNQFNLPVGMAGFTAPLPTVGNQPLTMEGLTVNFEWDF